MHVVKTAPIKIVWQLFEGGSGSISVEVVILKNNTLQSLLVTEANNRDEAIIKDSYKDGSDEVYGYQYYSTPETEAL